MGPRYRLQPGPVSLSRRFVPGNGRDEASRDEVYSLMATGDIYVDLESALLTKPAKVRVWLEKSLQPEGVQAGPPAFPWSGAEVTPPQIQQRLFLASEADLADATRRFHIVSRELGASPTTAYPAGLYGAG